MKSGIFGFPESRRADDFRLSRTFLQSVVFQLNFAPSEILRHRDWLQSILPEADFPNRRTMMSGEFSVEMTETPRIQGGTPQWKGFEYRSKDGQRTITVHEDFLRLAIVGQAYANFAQESPILFTVLEALQSKAELRLTRIGVRKINVFSVTPPEGEIPANALPYIFNVGSVTDMSVIPETRFIDVFKKEIRFKNDPYAAIVKYGLAGQEVNPKNQQRSLFLDIDVIGSKIGSYESVEAEFKRINTEVFEIFSFFLNDDILKILKEGVS